MTAVTDIDRVIIVIDRRDTDLALLVTRRLSEVLAERAPGGDGSRVDFGRVIVVDDAAALASHHEVYAHILDSHVDFSLLCLAIGPGPGDDPTLAVRRPFPLGPPKSATLWIGDVHGIGWRSESTQADLVHVPGQDAETKMPSGLIEVLRVPQVFDHVIEVVGAMPGAVACPGLRVTRSDIDTDVLIDAQRAAIRQLTDPGRGPGDPAPPVDASRLFSPQGRQPARTSDVIRPGGKIDELYQRSRRAEREVVQVRGRITGLVGLLSAEAGSLRGIIARFADALNELTDVMSRALDWADPRTGFDTVHRGQLDQLGIELSLVRPTGPSHTVEVLRA